MFLAHFISFDYIYPEIIEQELLKSSYIQEVVVYQRHKKLIAKAYLDQDAFDREFEHKNLSQTEIEKLKADILEQVRQETNQHLPEFSSVSKILEFPEPFEKTPTNKVKRYLYISQED